jgi:DNA (cytosine-5)-methyltransferase 1
MGFPEAFKVVVSDTQAYRQFGNAVVIPVIEWLGKALAKQAFGGVVEPNPENQLHLELRSVVGTYRAREAPTLVATGS